MSTYLCGSTRRCLVRLLCRVAASLVPAHSQCNYGRRSRISLPFQPLLSPSLLQLPHKGFQNDGRQGAVVYLPPGAAPGLLPAAVVGPSVPAAVTALSRLLPQMAQART